MRYLFFLAVIILTFCSAVRATEAVNDGFFESSRSSLVLRTFGYSNDNRDSDSKPSKTQELAHGLLLKFESGYTQGAVGYGVDASLLTGITLDSGRGRHQGSSMLPSNGDRAEDTWTRFAPTMKASLGKTEIRYGALMPKLPVITANDGRVLPQTFDGFQITSNVFDNFTLTGGVVEHAVGRGSSDRTGLSVSGSTRESNKFYFAGADWAVFNCLKAQYYFAELDDFYTQHFIGATQKISLGASSSLTTELRYFKTASAGANSSSAGRTAGYRTNGHTNGGTGEIDNNTWSVSSTYSFGTHALLLGYQSVSTGSNFVQLNQGGLIGKGAGGASTYLVTERFIQSFNRAGEQTVFGQYSYNFVGFGVPGLNASFMYLKGSNISGDNARNGSEWERDFTVDYVIQSGVISGVGFGWRNAKSHSTASFKQDQNRFFITYTIPLM